MREYGAIIPLNELNVIENLSSISIILNIETDSNISDNYKIFIKYGKRFDLAFIYSCRLQGDILNTK